MSLCFYFASAFLNVNILRKISLPETRVFYISNFYSYVKCVQFTWPNNYCLCFQSSKFNLHHTKISDNIIGPFQAGFYKSGQVLVQQACLCICSHIPLGI